MKFQLKYLQKFWNFEKMWRDLEYAEENFEKTPCKRSKEKFWLTFLYENCEKTRKICKMFSEILENVEKKKKKRKKEKV